MLELQHLLKPIAKQLVPPLHSLQPLKIPRVRYLQLLHRLYYVLHTVMVPDQQRLVQLLVQIKHKIVPCPRWHFKWKFLYLRCHLINPLDTLNCVDEVLYLVGYLQRFAHLLFVFRQAHIGQQLADELYGDGFSRD